MKLEQLRRLLGRIPPMVTDAALAAVLGGVGAVQLLSRRAPFQPGTDFLPRIPLPPPDALQPGNGLRFPGQVGAPPPFHEADPLTYILLGLCAGCLLLRRRFPLLTLAGVTLFGAAYLARGEQPFSVQLIVLVAVYSALADSTLGRIRAIAIAAAASAILGLAILYADMPRLSSNWAMDAAWVLAAIFLGDSVRSRRAYALEAERGREEEALRRVTEERVQIARELHDVVGHNISLINVQAGAGEHVLYEDAPAAQEAFKNIREASHETLQELRAMVGVLREPSKSKTELVPMQGMGGLEQLIKAVSDAGLRVDLAIHGLQHPLPGVVDLSAYRILQEALTNAVRHAPRSDVHVAIDYAQDALSLEVINGRGVETLVAVPGAGHGLAGMRERVAAIGGHLDVGPRPDGGFGVRAVLPTP